MRTYCICCAELPERMITAQKHFASHGVEADFVNGIHAATFAILCYRPNPFAGKAGELNVMPQAGLVLSHYMVWSICSHTPGDTFMILEDDAKFSFGWKERVDEAMKDLPEDWDIFLIGNSNTKDKPSRRINGEIYEVKYPFCTHAYIVRKKALPVLLAECRDCSMPVDTLMISRAYPKLNVFTLLPRAVDQRGTDLTE